ncbi:hypothetical protein E4U16_007933, partial [Claviceps sp. LM84 group G4]
DLRESPEVKRESSPRGGGSGKSVKIPDPERLDNDVSPKYKAWKGDMIAKLTINEDWYVTDAARGVLPDQLMDFPGLRIYPDGRDKAPLLRNPLAVRQCIISSKNAAPGIR